jgi:hypothetical protein
MAKCFRVVGQGVPVRMSDEDAFQVVVRDHDGEYCSKRFFKDWLRPAEGDTGIRKLVPGSGDGRTKMAATATLQTHKNKKRYA